MSCSTRKKRRQRSATRLYTECDRGATCWFQSRIMTTSSIFVHWSTFSSKQLVFAMNGSTDFAPLVQYRAWWVGQGCFNFQYSNKHGKVKTTKLVGGDSLSFFLSLVLSLSFSLSSLSLRKFGHFRHWCAWVHRKKHVLRVLLGAVQHIGARTLRTQPKRPPNFLSFLFTVCMSSSFTPLATWHKPYTSIINKKTWNLEQNKQCSNNEHELIHSVHASRLWSTVIFCCFDKMLVSNINIEMNVAHHHHCIALQHRSGCGMWVDQKDLKLYITGADMPRIHAAAALVGDLISKAPVNVNSAGVEDEVGVIRQ